MKHSNTEQSVDGNMFFVKISNVATVFSTLLGAPYYRALLNYGVNFCI